MRDGATVQLLSLARVKTTVVYLVRSLGLMPEFVSHDWHVQPSCQRPNRGPPKRCEFSPGELATRANPTVLEILQAYGAMQNPVNRRVPQDFQMISTAGPFWEAGAGELPRTRKQVPHRAFSPIRNDKLFGRRSEQRATVCSSGRNETPLSAHADTEDKKLRKDPLEVLALKVPFGTPYVKPAAFRMKSRGRDD